MKLTSALPLGIFVLVVVAIAGCTSSVQTGTSVGLTIEDSFLALQDAQGTLILVEGNTFTRGQSVNFVFMNVGEFEKGSDGKNWFDIDLAVTGPDGKSVLSQQGMLGENGHIALDGNVAASPYAGFPTTASMPTGTYQVTMIIKDKVGGTSATKSTTFTLA
ncbi:MAG: hypothetical protein HY832_01335 [Candidatus Aenigmarchaeota archaeon]|nr:hypothetical protein [Candidatus Aenigmarchaeota archaeon]